MPAAIPTLLPAELRDSPACPAAPRRAPAGAEHPCDRWEVARTVGEMEPAPAMLPPAPAPAPGTADRALSALARALCGVDAPRLPHLLTRWRAVNPPGPAHAKFRA